MVLVAAVGTAHAQSATTGAVQGRVTDAASKEPLAGVSVWITGPAMPEPRPVASLEQLVPLTLSERWAP